MADECTFTITKQQRSILITYLAEAGFVPDETEVYNAKQLEIAESILASHIEVPDEEFIDAGTELLKMLFDSLYEEIENEKR